MTNYRELVRLCLALESKASVFICRPCPVVRTGNLKIVEENIQLQIPWIDALAAELKIDVIDMHAALKDTPELIPDRVHPNAKGAEEMSKAAVKALTGKNAKL